MGPNVHRRCLVLLNLFTSLSTHPSILVEGGVGGGAPTLTVDPMSVSALRDPCAELGPSTLAVAVGVGGDSCGRGRKEGEEGRKGREVEAYKGVGDRGWGWDCARHHPSGLCVHRGWDCVSLRGFVGMGG